MANCEFYVVIEKDEDGFSVGEVPQLRSCYTQGKTLDELMVNIKEVIELCLEDEGDVDLPDSSASIKLKSRTSWLDFRPCRRRM